MIEEKQPFPGGAERFILYEYVLKPAIAEANRFLAETLPQLVKDKENKDNLKLSGTDPSDSYKVGDDFLKGKIVKLVDAPAGADPSEGSVFVRYVIEGGNIQLPGLDQPKPLSELSLGDLKKIKGQDTGFSQSNLSAVVELARKVNYTRSAEPLLIIRDVPAYSLEVASSSQVSKTIDLRFGISKIRTYSGPPGAEVAIDSTACLVELSFQSEPKFKLYGFVGVSSNDGIIIRLGTEGLKVPLGTLPFLMTGISVLYGEKYGPDIDLGRLDDPIDEIARAKPMDVAKWARTAELLAWAPSRDDIRVYGLNTVIGDIASSGKLIRISQCGVTYMSVGPRLWVGGNLTFLSDDSDQNSSPDAEPRSAYVSVIGLIDFQRQTLALSSEFKLEPLKGWRELSLEGASELQASFKYPSDWYYAIGGYDMNRCKVSLPWFNMTGGFRVTPTHIAMAAEVRFRLYASVLGISVEFWTMFGFSVLFGWNPQQVQGRLYGRVSFKIEVCGIGFSLSFNVNSQFSFPKPKQLSIKGKCSVSIGPFYDKDIEWTLIDEKDPPETPEPEANLQLKDGFKSLAVTHPPSGSSSELNSDPAKPEVSKVWPDCEISVPFKRLAFDPQGRLFGTDGMRGVYNEGGGVETRHLFTGIHLYKIDTETGVEEEINDYFGYWQGVSTGNGTVSGAQLQIPSGSPLAWLAQFDYAYPGDSEQDSSWHYQYFGAGRATLIDPGHLELQSFSVDSASPFFLMPFLGFSQTRLALFYGNYSVLLSVDGLDPLDPLGPKRLASAISILTFERDEVHVKFDEIDGAGNPVFTADGRSTLKVTRSRVRSYPFGLNLVSRVLERNDGGPIAGVRTSNVNSERGMNVLAIGYSPFIEVPTVDHKKVLTPGRYRLKLYGTTIARLLDGGADKPKDWPEVDVRFDVVLPDKLRPYILYSTFGDERLFGMPWKGWYPSPFGVGLPGYFNYQNVIRFRVHYMEKIFPKMFIQFDDGLGLAPPIEKIVDVKRSVIPRHRFTKVPWEWYESRGIQISPSEIAIEDVIPPGSYEVRIGRVNPDQPDERAVLDTWHCLISQYPSPDDHLRVMGAVRGVYGNFGYRPTDKLNPPAFPQDDVLEQAKNAQSRTAATLSPKLFELEASSVSAGLNYLRLFEFYRVFEGTCSPSESPVRPAADPGLNHLMDQDGNVVALIARSNEPIDWRRVSVVAYYSTFSPPHDSKFYRFDVRVSPSHDGCSAALFLLADSLPVKIPRGGFKFVVSYDCGKDGLPVLRDLNDPHNGSRLLKVDWTFYQRFGSEWKQEGVKI
ncbi:MAG: hypothetical protein IPL32_17200 [Chloracidobacterium sp.]|nr:hypothetical protein [Chloracidobacterium sp.]